MENSFHSRGSKNFVLKSDYLNNTNNSKHNSRKNLSFYDNANGQNQKSLFRTSQSFIDQEEEENKRERLKSINTSNKDSENNFFNNMNLYNNETNEPNNFGSFNINEKMLAKYLYFDYKKYKR